MKIIGISFMLLSLMLCLVAVTVNAEESSKPTIDTVSPLSPNNTKYKHILKITGTNFGKDRNKSSVKLTCINGEQKVGVVPITIEQWSDKEIAIEASPISSETVFVELAIQAGEVASGATATVVKEIHGYQFNIVTEAKKLKETYINETSILESLAHEINTYRPSWFTNSTFVGTERTDLKSLGYSDDFVAKLAADPQHVTVGVAEVWLARTAELATTPILRIFIVPKSYFNDERRTWRFWTANFWNTVDFNIGYTTVTPTSNNNTEQEKKSYVLVGFSKEINRAALLNIGYAKVPGDTKGVDSQFYLGITVDYNFLKDIGLVSQ